MPKYTQAGRALALGTPLGPDALLLEKVSGVEAISELYRFALDLLAEPDTDVSFERVLGRAARVDFRVGGETARAVHGVVSRLSQGAEVRGPGGDVTFVRYRAVLVPRVWFLTRRAQSRVFQQVSVPDILAAVFDGFDRRAHLVGTYEKRDYCVQYRETDFAFASRLMEEEGIFYHFEQGADGETLVLGDHPAAHPKVAGPASLTYDTVRGGNRPEGRVLSWEKSQEVRSGRVTLRDHSFEVAHQDLEAQAKVQPAARVGGVEHSLAAGGADGLELYDYPGGYAQRFDGVGPGGVDRDDIRHVFTDNARTARVRMEQEAARGLEVGGGSDCRHLAAGHAFALARHFNADGEYVLTRVEHAGDLDGVYTGGAAGASYTNTFRCLPAGLPYRPARTTPRPVIHGTQSAVVVGPPGEEIFTDKYGRVKAQFPWDRDGKHDADSSCWVRVSQVHAGKGWGGIDVPRVGEEVVVAFEEGDPDRPIVIGRVYNSREMPPFDLPGKAMVSGLKSNTYPGGGGSNEFSMDDTKGAERMYVHAQFNQDEVVENDQTSHVKNNRAKTVDVDETTTIGNNRAERVGVDETVTVGANRTHTVGADHKEEIGANMSRSVGGSKSESVGMSSTETVTLAKAVSVGGAMALSVGGVMNTAVGVASFEEVGLVKKVVVGQSFEIVCGAARIVLEASGKVTIEGSEFLFKASGDVKVQGSVIDLN